MAFQKLPRLPVDWLVQPELFRRYWDKLANAIEALYNTDPLTFSTLPTPEVGQSFMVSDIVSLTPADVFTVYTGGGTFTGPIFWDGTDFRIG